MTTYGSFLDTCMSDASGRHWRAYWHKAVVRGELKEVGGMELGVGGGSGLKPSNIFD